MRGGGQRLFGIFLKIHPIWRSHPPLRKVSFTKQGLTTDGAAGGLKDVVALPRLLDLSPRGGCACGQTSATGVTHAGEHQSLEQTCIPDSTRAAPRLHGLAFLSSSSNFYSHTPALEKPQTRKSRCSGGWASCCCGEGGLWHPPPPSVARHYRVCSSRQGRPVQQQLVEVRLRKARPRLRTTLGLISSLFTMN